MMGEILDERSEKVLLAVIKSYIENPDPVGSRYVTKKYDFRYSPATIRNIMADLEDLGFLSQPHTSAGRVPTDKAYRYYVENIIDERKDYNELLETLYDKIRSGADDMDTLLDETSKTLSSISKYLGLAVSPGPEGSVLRKIEFVPYKDDRIAVVILTDEGVIRHKIIKNELALNPSELSRISNYLNKEYKGYTIKQIREHLAEELRRDKAMYDNMINRSLSLCREALYTYGSHIFITGLSQMLDLPEFSDIERIKRISKTIEDKRAIINLIDRIMDSDGVQVIIGTENPVSDMKELSVIVSTYKEKGRPSGVIGIIGPKRMDYSTVISLVDSASRILTKLFEEGG
jgi:heat-inducible transcriptional repressor